MTMKLLKVENLSKNKENSLMLEQINFEIKTGQIYGIITDNQDKLNTFINILGGIEKEDHGNIYFKGKKLIPSERIKKVGIASGNYKLVDNLNVLENIFLGNSKRYANFGFLNKKKMKQKALEIMNKLQILINLKLKVKYLNRHEKLFIEIARVLAKEIDFYIFGHITRALSLRQFEAFGNILKDLKQKGKCVIVLPGTADDIKMFVDKLFFLKNSRLLEIENCRELSNEKLNELLLTSEKSQVMQVFDPIYKAKMIINEKIGISDLDFQDIANKVYMGYENFRRRFKNEVGLSPNQYFIKLKIEKAKEMLLYTHLEIKEIAEKLGFSDPYYFSRIFKDKETISPNKFREKRMDSVIEE
jgi:ABC-type uncharacterized transport system ATPase subunit